MSIGNITTAIISVGFVIYLIVIVLRMRSMWKKGLRMETVATGSLHLTILNILIIIGVTTNGIDTGFLSDVDVANTHIMSIPIKSIVKIISSITPIMMVFVLGGLFIIGKYYSTVDEYEPEIENGKNVPTSLLLNCYAQTVIFGTISSFNFYITFIEEIEDSMSMFLFIYTPTLVITACVTYMLYSALKWEYIENKDVEKTHNPHHTTPLHS